MVVQIRLPALRDMKKKSKDFGDHVDRIYRERTLMNQLESTPLLRGTDEQFIKELARRVDSVIAWAIENAPVEKPQLSLNDFYDVRKNFLIIASKGHPFYHEPEPSEGGAQYINVTPAPWP